jgi:hypothetical protein
LRSHCGILPPPVDNFEQKRSTASSGTAADG